MAHRFIIDDQTGQLYKDFTGRRLTSAAEVLRAQRGITPTFEIFLINVASDTGAVTAKTLTNAQLSVAIGNPSQPPQTGIIKAAWSDGGSLYESPNLDLESLTASSLESAFNSSVYPVYIAKGLTVEQIGLGKYLLTMKKVGAISGAPSINVEGVDPPSGVEVNSITTGDSDTKAQWVISLAQLPVATIDAGSFSTVDSGSFSGLGASISLNTTGMLAAINRGNRDFEFAILHNNHLLHRSQVRIDESLDPTASGTIVVTNTPLANYLPLAGGTMSGAIAMGSNKITGLADGVASGDAATKGQLDALIDGSPDNLNTLNELAAALNDDQNFSTTVTNNIASKLPKDGSEAMTGALTVPSVNVGDSHTLANDANDNLEIKSSSSEDLILNGYNVYLKNNHTNGILATFGAYNTTLSTPVRISTGSAASPSLTFSSDTNSGIFGGTDIIGFTTGGTEAARFDSSGNLCLGNTSAAAKLDIRADSGTAIRCEDASGGYFVVNHGGKVGIGGTPNELLQIDGTSPKIRLRDTDASGTPYVHFDASDGNILLSADAGNEIASSNIQFAVDGTEAARFDSSGHFLIPDDNKIKLGNDADLEIYNAANSNSVIKKTNLGGLFLLNDSTTYIQGTFGEDMARFIKDGAVELFYDGTKRLDTTSSGININGGITFDSTFTEIIRSSNSLRINIDNDGNQTDRVFIVSANSGMDELFRVQEDGKVGIGGTPVVELDLQGDMMVTNTAPRFILKESGSAKDICFKVQTDGRLSIFDDNQVNEMVTVKQDGKFGINDTSPDYTLDVNGDIGIGDYAVLKSTSSIMGMLGLNRNVNNGAIYNSSYAAFQIQNNVGKLEFQCYNSSGTIQQINVIDENGKVGIGSTAPNALLNVQGDSDPTILINAVTGNSSNSGKLAFAETDGGAHQAFIKYDGSANKLEIGTADVSKAFVIDRTNANIQQNFINYTDASNYEALRISAESDHILFKTESVGSFSSEERDLRFTINGTEKGRISSTGVWTFGNFYISGSGSLRNYGNTLKLTTGGGDYDINFGPNDVTRMTLKSDTGRLGVNNTNPQKTVDVTGDIRASTNVFASNNVYAAFKYVFGTSTSEGEYIERNSSNLDFYAGGGNRFTVEASGDCEILDDGKGLILSSPDGTRYKITVANGGAVTSTAM